MATEWMPLTRFDPRSWLLANGEVITEPALEQTSTGRKIRVVGSTTSFYSSELDKLLADSAKAAATARGTTVMVEVKPPTEAKAFERNALGYNTADEMPAKFHVVHDPTTNGAATTLWWRFKHPKAPFEAVLSVRLMNYAMHSVPSRQYLQVALAFPSTSQRYGGYTYALQENCSYSTFVDHLDDDTQYKWREFFRDTRPNWDDSTLGSKYINTHYKAVETVLGIARHFESLDTLQIPDLTNLDNPGWLELELYETNVNAELISDMSEWLDANPLAEGVLNAYQNLLDQLARSGFSVNEKSNNDFLSALLSGNTASMGMAVMNSLDHDGHVDRFHTVSVHLPTGTFIVECSHNALDREEISERWDEVRTIASLSGEEDVLLEYARAAAAKEAHKKAKSVIKSRQ